VIEIPTGQLLRILRLGLLLSSIGWGISLIFTFSSWKSVSDQLYGMGAGKIEYRPMLDYWLRMASSAFGGIGIASAIALFYPKRFFGVILLLGPFHLFVGTVLLIAAINNDLKMELHHTFVADITFCFATAILILIPILFAKRAASKISTD
jgi:hypothetical protein